MIFLRSPSPYLSHCTPAGVLTALGDSFYPTIISGSGANQRDIECELLRALVVCNVLT